MRKKRTWITKDLITKDLYDSLKYLLSSIDIKNDLDVVFTTKEIEKIKQRKIK